MATARRHEVQCLVPVAVKRDEVNVLAPGGVDEKVLIRRIARILFVRGEVE